MLDSEHEIFKTLVILDFFNNILVLLAQNDTKDLAISVTNF